MLTNSLRIPHFYTVEREHHLLSLVLHSLCGVFREQVASVWTTVIVRLLFNTLHQWQGGDFKLSCKLSSDGTGTTLVSDPMTLKMKSLAVGTGLDMQNVAGTITLSNTQTTNLTSAGSSSDPNSADVVQSGQVLRRIAGDSTILSRYIVCDM